MEAYPKLIFQLFFLKFFTPDVFENIVAIYAIYYADEGSQQSLITIIRLRKRRSPPRRKKEEFVVNNDDSH